MPEIWILLDRYITLLLSWPSVVLIIFFSLRQHICNLFNASGDAINRISELGFKGLSVILRDPNFSAESKDKLTKYFIDTRNDFRNALNTVSSLNNPLRKIINIIKYDLGHSERNELIQNLVDAFEKLLSISRLYPDRFEKEIISVEAVKKSLLTKTQADDEINIPLCEAFSKLEPHWRDMDPDDFQFLKNLREKLTKLLKD